jgi:hypothetical protein
VTVAIIHPRFLASVPAGFFPSECTIEGEGTPTQDEYGEETPDWDDVDGLVDIPCAKAPLSAIERQAAGYTARDQAWNVLLKGAFPQITTNHRAVIDGDTLDIDAAETDQTSTVTRLRVRSVTT